MNIKSLFTDMFVKKRKITKEKDLFSQLENNPNMDGFHVFSARSHVDYGYGHYRLQDRYGALEYVGSSKDEVLIRKLSVLDIRYTQNFMVVLKGKLMELKPIVENYTETIEKEKVVGYVLE